MNIGLRYRELREKAGLSQEEVASRIGQVRQAVVRFESPYSNPTIRALQEMLSAIGVTYAEFFASSIPDSYAIPSHRELHEQLQEILETDTNALLALTYLLKSAYLTTMRERRVKRRKARVEKTPTQRAGPRRVSS